MKKHFVNARPNCFKASSKALKTYKQCQMLMPTDFAYFGLLTSPLTGFKRNSFLTSDEAAFIPLAQAKPHRFNNHLPYVLINSGTLGWSYGNLGYGPKESRIIVPHICGGHVDLSLRFKSKVSKTFIKASLSAKASELALDFLDKTAPKKTNESQRLRLVENYNILGCVVLHPKCIGFISPNELKQSALVKSTGCAKAELSLLKPVKKPLKKTYLNLRLSLICCVQHTIKLKLKFLLNTPDENGVLR